MSVKQKEPKFLEREKADQTLYRRPLVKRASAVWVQVPVPPLPPAYVTVRHNLTSLHLRLLMGSLPGRNVRIKREGNASTPPSQSKCSVKHLFRCWPLDGHRGMRNEGFLSGNEKTEITT